MLTDSSSILVEKLFSEYENKPFNTNTLAEIASSYSMDVATLYFIQRSYQNAKNRQAQDVYQNYLETLSNESFGEDVVPLEDFYLVFVPGLHYSDTSNRGNFARQRRLLAANGIHNELILTDDWGLTDHNAEIVAKRLKQLSNEHDNIIVVSSSKGGLETAIALSKILKPEETKSINTWVSVGGILNGSPLADRFLRWPKRWIVAIGLLTVKQKLKSVRDLSYEKRAAEFKDFNFPDNIKRVHFVGAPLATQIHKRIKRNYCSIKQFGPNDGITPLVDQVSEGGIIISELGLDHYYVSPDIDKKTIALALVAAANQN